MKETRQALLEELAQVDTVESAGRKDLHVSGLVGIDVSSLSISDSKCLSSEILTVLGRYDGSLYVNDDIVSDYDYIFALK